jgi:stage II sporulation protein D
MIARRSFIAMALAAALPLPARAGNDFDPATNATSQELRVLLGPGNAFPLARGGFLFGGRPYRGAYAVTPDGVVNTVGLEEYLYSVVPREMPAAWPANALQAQAICARTYVLQRSNPRRAYDLVPSELDQVYGGVASETPASRDAVDATHGFVLRYAGQFALVMYSSCCGGHTESASDAWGGPPIPYLGGVRCTTCTAAPYYRWSRPVALGDIEQQFTPQLAGLGALQTIALAGTDPSGRARALMLQAQNGAVQIKGSAFRSRVGVRIIPSLLITRIDGLGPEQVTFQGGGLGHGVGLCQWGARGLAQQGARFSEILSFYFPGTEIDHD